MPQSYNLFIFTEVEECGPTTIISVEKSQGVKEQAQKIGYISELERAGCEILSDCCTCLTPLICKDDVDAVTTNSIKGAFYLKNSNGVGINLKSLQQIVEDETR